MSDEQMEVGKDAKPTRRAMVSRTLIGLGAGMLLQPKGGVAQDTKNTDKKKKKKKKSNQDDKKM